MKQHKSPDPVDVALVQYDICSGEPGSLLEPNPEAVVNMDAAELNLTWQNFQKLTMSTYTRSTLANSHYVVQRSYAS